MSEKITLTPAPYAVFSTLAACGGKDVNYRALRTVCGYDDKKNFPNLIQELVSKDLIHREGQQSLQTVSLKVDPSEVVLVTKQPAGKGDNSKPSLKEKAKKRNCLKCRTVFDSMWYGERVCKPCKGSAEWIDNSPFAPVGGGSSSLSGMKMGVTG